MSRTALDGFPLGDIEKDFLLDLIKRYSALYFVEILGFCIIGNHFHLLVKMIPEYNYTDEDIQKRYKDFYGDDQMFAAGWIPSLRKKLSSLSEFVAINYQKFKNLFVSKKDKVPKPVSGLNGVYSLKRLSEAI